MKHMHALINFRFQMLINITVCTSFCVEILYWVRCPGIVHFSFSKLGGFVLISTPWLLKQSMCHYHIDKPLPTPYWKAFIMSIVKCILTKYLPKHLLTIDGTSLCLMYTSAQMKEWGWIGTSWGKDHTYQYNKNCVCFHVC